MPPEPSLPGAFDNSPTMPVSIRGENSGRNGPTNRLRAVLAHAPRYMFDGRARLAEDIGAARSTISRLMNGQSNPSVRVVQAVQAALEREIGRPLPLSELFSPDGTYPTPSGCALCGCPGCMPERAYDRRGNLKPAFQNMRPGDWSLSPQHSATMQRSATLPVNEHK